MPNLVVIFGPPASGKAAVGDALSSITGYRFFHNHLTTDAAAAIFGWDNERFPRVVLELRELLFREAAADPSIPGVIFTFVWGLNVAEDHQLMERVTSLFAGAGGQVLFVELLASLEARLAREGTPFRVGLKPAHRDVEAARARQVETAARYRMNTGGKLPLDYPHLIVDTEALAPEEAAAFIASKLEVSK
jgi:cytidylate kinase